MEFSEIAVAAVTILGSSGGAWLAVKERLSNLENHTNGNSRRLDSHDHRLDKHGNRITALETWRSIYGGKS